MPVTSPGLAIVTGGAQRIGEAIVRELAEHGWAVAIHYHQSATPAHALAVALKAKGQTAHCFAADLSVTGQPQQLIADITRRMGQPTALVNNASRFQYDSIDTLQAQGWDAHLAANLTGPVFLAQAFAATCDPANDCCVVNVLDQKIANPNPDFFSYSVGKLALAGATRLMADAWRGRIRVHGIAPGLTLPSADQTADEFAVAHAACPLGAGSTPADLARAVRFVLETPSYCSDILMVDGGQHLQPRRRDVMFETRTRDSG